VAATEKPVAPVVFEKPRMVPRSMRNPVKEAAIDLGFTIDDYLGTFPDHTEDYSYIDVETANAASAHSFEEVQPSRGKKRSYAEVMDWLGHDNKAPYDFDTWYDGM
jgi:hypothetical protein